MEQTQTVHFLLDDETGNGNMVYDQTASGIDVGDDIIHESGIDFSKKNVTITDSSGASGTIVKIRYCKRNNSCCNNFNICWKL